MINHDHWLQFQAGCYEQAAACSRCGYELCEHGMCRHCAGCAGCEAEEERMAKKACASVRHRAARRKAG